jgi:hypothetical protein
MGSSDAVGCLPDAESRYHASRAEQTEFPLIAECAMSGAPAEHGRRSSAL